MASVNNPLFIIDDQAHYLANEVRSKTVAFEEKIRLLKESYSLKSIDSHSSEGFVKHFFTQTATHMACLNIFGLSEICGVSIIRSIEMFAKTRDLAPDRIILFGLVNPLEEERAIEEIDRQFFKLGAKAFKFYPMDPYGGPSGWWCDDPKIAFPIWEKISSLGMKYVSVHKLPLPMIANKWQDPKDIDGAAASFPELNFIIYHMGYPEIERVANICANRPNVYVDFGGPLIPAIVFKPEWFSDQFCKFLAVAPISKVCWGSDMMVTPGGQEYIEALWKWQVPERFQSGYGIEPVSEEQRKMILGGTFARLAGIDIPKQLKKIANDSFSQMQNERVRTFLEQTS